MLWHTQTDVSKQYDDEMMNMGIMWQAFSMQRGPVRKKNKMITEWYRLCKKITDSKNKGKENLQAPSASPCQDMDNLPRWV
jgi:hypothetical protein